MPSPDSARNALTLRSILAALFGIVATGVCVQFFEIIEAGGNFLASYAVPIAAMMVFIPLLIFIVVVKSVARIEILSRPEILFVMFCAMIAAPLASGGFWSMMIGPIGSVPKTAYFEVYDAMPEKIWPRSKNILASALDPRNADSLKTTGRAERGEAEVWLGGRQPVIKLENSQAGEFSSVRISVPVAGAGDDFDDGFVVEEPYLLNFLFRPRELGVESRYVCRVYFSEKMNYDVDVFSARAIGPTNYLYRTGFMRQGMYNLVVPIGVEGPVIIEFGLEGPGRIEIAECELISVGALDSIYQGRRQISAADMANRPPGPLPRTLIAEPQTPGDFIYRYTAGYVPWGQWAAPYFSWSMFGVLLLMGTLCVAAIMHRQWIENERYPLPMTRIPMAMLEADEGGAGQPPLWKRRIVWVGFGLSLFWCLMKGWNAYNSNVPNMNVVVDLSPYFTDPLWGRMWKGEEVRNVTFMVTAVFLSLAIFMELNVLLSLALGFLLYRSQFWVGEMTGMALQQDYPFFRQQQIGAFLMYGLAILFFSRKYLWRVAALALGRGGESAPAASDAKSYRLALAGLVVCFAGLAFWARWNGIPFAGMFILYVIALMVGLVAMKLRAECGVLMGWFAPVALVQVLFITGGMPVYGAKGVVFVCMASYIVFQYFLFMIPGMQMEMLALTKRYKVGGAQIAGALIFASVAGIMLGGWVHLNLGFGLGGDNYSQRWPYMDKPFVFQEYNQALTNATAALEPGAPGTGVKPAHWAYIFGGVVTVILAFLRQAFSGFWFHPIGYVVGMSTMMEYVWGSVLTACLIRWVTFKLGGAVTVRTKLMPFFVGVFAGALAAYLIFGMLNTWLYFYYPSVIRKSFGMLF